MNIRLSVVLSLALMHTARLHTQEPDPAPKREISATILFGKPAGERAKIRLFILSGQSNMAALSHRQSVMPALEEAFPEDTLILVKDARSGQPIIRWAANWKPVGDWEPRNARQVPGNHDLYRKLIGMVNEATDGKSIDTVSFLWMQGERDARSGQSENYADALRGLIEQIRTDTGHPDATVVVGRLSDFKTGDEHWDRVRAAQMAVCEADPHASWIDTDAWNGTNDGLHYSGDGYQALGEAFAAETVELLNAEP